MERLLKIGFIVFLCIYFVFAVAMRIPAQWAAKAIVNAAPSVKLGTVSGTLWEGKSASAVVVVHGQNIDLGSLSWQVHPSSLLGLRICADISTTLVETGVCRGLSGNNSFSNLIIEELPAKILNNMLGFARIEGVFSLAVKSATVNDKGVVSQMDGHMTWERASGDAGGGWYDLGSFSADVKENSDGGVTAYIKDTAGEFAMDLEGGFSFAKGPSLKGTITPRPAAPEQLVDSLGLFTEARDDGSYFVNWPM